MGLIPVGRVLSTHGIRGEVKFKYYNEAADEFYRYVSFIAKKGTEEVVLRPVQVRPHKGFFLIKFAGLDNPDGITFLLNKQLFVDERDLPALEEDEYYEYQLIGMDVINERNDRIGRVGEIIHTGAQSVMVVSGKQEFMIPMVDEFIVQIDLPGSSIMVKEDPFLV